MAGRRAPFLSVLCFICTVLWIKHKTGLAKECTNIPNTNSHTLRASVFDKIISQSHNNLWTALSAERTSSASVRRDLVTSPLAEHLSDPLEDWNRKRSKDFSRILLSQDNSALCEGGNDTRETYHVGTATSTILFDAFLRAPRKLSHRNYDTGNHKAPASAKNFDGGLSATSSQWAPHSLLKGVSLHRVTLAADSLHGIAQETNLQYLLMLDVDRLVWSFRVTAGLPAPGNFYSGWEDPTQELRGHFVGHYLSATALMWASTHNDILKHRMSTLVDALWECQDQIGTGYLSAFPSELFDRFEAIQPVWAPYYTIHKIMAGLFDQYILAGNEKAMGMLLWMAEYFLRRVETVICKYSIERHWTSLNEEVGGMNDIMYRLFMVTQDPRHLKLAHLFDKPCFLGLLALQTDGLSGFHSNTHIPLVVGAQMRFEATGDKLYAHISQYFMHIINATHRYATGGTSVSEFWTDPNRNGDVLTTENQETCTTYNMLKIARNLFRWTQDVRYADYYERALVNGILGIQRGTEPGKMIYMLPQGPGTSKAASYHGWGTPFYSFWCCYGTGVESFSKLGDSIYFEDYDSDYSLIVSQFVSSNLTWDAVGLLLTQKVLPLSSSDPCLHVTFEFYDLPRVYGKRNPAKLSLRIPAWVTATSHVRLNGMSIRPPTPGNYFSISRTWKAGDALHVDLPLSLSLEKIQDDRKQYSFLHAILFGPYLLAGMTDGEIEIGAVNTSSLSSWIIPVPTSYSDQLYSFSQDWIVDAVPINIGDSEAQGFPGALVMSYQGTSPEMRSVPLGGTDEAVKCTFRLISASLGISNDPVIGQLVSFEPYSQPGKLLIHNGVNRKLRVVGMEPSFRKPEFAFDNAMLKTHHHVDSTYSDTVGFEEGHEVFQILPGLSGENNTVSFEAVTLQGCFISSNLDATITLKCRPKGEGKDPNFDTRASFSLNKGLTTYNPVSFFAKGKNKQFLVFPIYAYQDERYATYFNLTAI